MVLSQDFREFLESLNAHDVRYLLVGGYAVAYHGHPRYTKDLDVWVWLDPENATRLIDALSDFGFSLPGLTAQDFLDPSIVVQLGHPPNRIDLITETEGVEFDECFATRVQAEVEGTSVNIIDLESLKKNKKAVGRHQDLADLESLE